jgi:hypothetical protein
MTSENDGMIWFRTEPTPDGKGYMITVDFDDDHSVALNRSEALAYASDVITAVARAEYDAAVMNQMAPKFDDLATPFQLVKDMRADRPEFTGLGDLGLEPSAAMDSLPDGGVRFRPFIAIYFKSEKIGQWDSQTAREHAIGLLEVAAVCDLDAAYVRELVGMVGLSHDAAVGVVNDLMRHR